MKKKNSLFFVIGFIIASTVSASAVMLCNGKDITYNPSDESWDVDTVSDALNDLNYKFENDYCAKGYECNPKKYTISYILNDGSTLSEESKEVTYKSKYGKLATSEKSGYSLAWYLDEDYTQRVTEETTVKITENTNLYGKWVVSLYNKVEEQVDTSKKSSDFSYSTAAGGDNGLGVYEYNGEQDSDGGTKPIYFYRGLVTNNNVIFAGYCWQIVRTTSTGGTKMIYNGTPENGVCNGANPYIGESRFNDVPMEESKYYHAFYTYDENNYYGTGTDSTIKHYIEQVWYPTSNLNNQTYEDMMEDTPYCMDRTPYTNNSEESFTNPSDSLNGAGFMVPTYTELDCNESDLLSVSNGVLRKKISLLIAPEFYLSGSVWIGNKVNGSTFLWKNFNYPLLSPWGVAYKKGYCDLELGAYVLVNTENQTAGAGNSYYMRKVRPVISILNSIEVKSGDGTKDTPYIIE